VRSAVEGVLSRCSWSPQLYSQSTFDFCKRWNRTIEAGLKDNVLMHDLRLKFEPQLFHVSKGFRSWRLCPARAFLRGNFTGQKDEAGRAIG
jgi:hypothetical protein